MKVGRPACLSPLQPVTCHLEQRVLSSWDIVFCFVVKMRGSPLTSLFLPALLCHDAMILSEIFEGL